MTQTFEDANKLGKEFLDSSMKSFATLSEGRAGDLQRGFRLREEGLRGRQRRARETAFGEILEKAIEIQTDYAKQAYEGFVAEATKMGELYADMAKDAYKPFESIVAKAK